MGITILVTAIPSAGAGALSPTAAQQGVRGAVFVFGSKQYLPGATRSFRGIIYATGRVVVSGSAVRVRRHDFQLWLSDEAIKGLLKLAQAEGFYSMPNTIDCTPHPTGMLMSGYVNVQSSGGIKSVTAVEPTCNANFAQLYAVLLAAGGVDVEAHKRK
jgi:hypothetical protein